MGMRLEHDGAEWVHAGLTCVIWRHNEFGHWCGYVGIPSTHPLYNVDYVTETFKGTLSVSLDVHGGVTFSGKKHWTFSEDGSPEPDDLWYLGFDCAHAGDLLPQGPSRYLPGRDPGAAYRTEEYAREETERLAEQLAAISRKQLKEGE